MNRSSNASDSTLGVTTRVTEQKDGTFVAQAVGKIGDIVGPVKGRSSSEAMNLHKQAINAAAASGKI